MSKTIGWTILISLFGGLHAFLIIDIGIKALWTFLAYPITALLVFAVLLICGFPREK